MLLDYPSSQALWILFADQRPTLALGLLFVLSVLYLLADVLTLPVFLTMSWNKACTWIRTPHVSLAPLQHYWECPQKHHIHFTLAYISTINVMRIWRVRLYVVGVLSWGKAPGDIGEEGMVK